jgi:hypothetical protein
MQWNTYINYINIDIPQYIHIPKTTRCAFLSVKKINDTRHQWLTPVILAAQEAEIRRIAI